MIDQAELEKIWSIILSGGPVMIALAALAFMLYRNVIGLFLFVSSLKARAELEAVESEPDRAAVVDFRRSLRELVASQLKYAKVLIVAAPLLGLLGTVMGMLDTFKGISSESGRDTTQAVADGVKVALITTQTGLMIAILGLFLTQWIARIHRRKDLELVEVELDAISRKANA